MVLRIPGYGAAETQDSFKEERKIGIKLQKGTSHTAKIRERKGPSQGILQKMRTSRGHKRKHCTNNDASAEKLKTKDKATFFAPSEVWVMPAPSSKKPAEREFAVDSWASMHMLGRLDQSSAELETFPKCRKPTTDRTAKWEVQTNEEAQVYVHDLHLFVTVQILDDTLAVLSRGKLFEERGYS